MKTRAGPEPVELSGPPPGQLSGQRQRVAIGRAIVREPKAFLFDEPLEPRRRPARRHAAGNQRVAPEARQTTMIYVTHDQVEAMTMADKIVVLNAGRSSRSAARLSFTTARQPVRRRLHRQPQDELHHRTVRRRNGAHTIGVRPEHVGGRFPPAPSLSPAALRSLGGATTTPGAKAAGGNGMAMTSQIATPAMTAASSARVSSISAGQFPPAHMAVYLDDLFNLAKASDRAIIGLACAAPDTADSATR